jgi:hypothetical protein
VTDGDGDPVGGIATGPQVMGVLEDAGGSTEGYQWEYGAGVRSEFQPHLDLDGEIRAEPSEFEWGASYDGFPDTDTPFPGDHPGCSCDLTPILVGPEGESQGTETPEMEQALAQAAAPEEAGTEPLAFADAQDATEWLTTAMPHDFTPAQVDAIDDYKLMKFNEINTALRAGDTSDPVIAKIDEAMARSTTPAPVRTYRVMQLPSKEVPAVGATFSDGAYTSTTLDPKFAQETFENWKDTPGTFLMELDVPAGTNAIAMDTTASNIVSSESELLLDRGLTYQITDTREVDGVTRLTATIEPQAEAEAEAYVASTETPAEFATRMGWVDATGDVTDEDLKAAKAAYNKIRADIQARAKQLAYDTRGWLQNNEMDRIGFIARDAQQDWYWSDMSKAERSRLRTNGWVERENVAKSRSAEEHALMQPSEVEDKLKRLLPDLEDAIGRGTEPMSAWVEYTRMVDLADALANGKQINLARYGGWSYNKILESPYDLDAMFGAGDKSLGVGMVAQVNAEQGADDAIQIFGYASGPGVGTPPYEMTEADYIAELTALEPEAAAVQPLGSDEWTGPYYSEADQAIINRVNQLIPAGLDDGQMSYAQLYQAIIQTAREGGLI